MRMPLGRLLPLGALQTCRLPRNPSWLIGVVAMLAAVTKSLLPLPLEPAGWALCPEVGGLHSQEAWPSFRCPGVLPWLPPSRLLSWVLSSGDRRLLSEIMGGLLIVGCAASTASAPALQRVQNTVGTMG